MTEKIYTNKHRRQFLYGYEVPQEIHDWYDWLDGDDRLDGWIKYRNNYYHLSDFMRFDYPGPINQNRYWQAYHGDSYFSGVLIHICDGSERDDYCDSECYTIATYIS